MHDGSSRKEVISIADKKFRSRDKIVQKMTKDGLVDENLRTGEQKSATAEEKPEQEDSVNETAEKETDEEPVVDEEICMDAEDGEDAPRHHNTAKQSADYYKAHQEDGKPKDAPAGSNAEPQPTKKGRLSFEDEKGGIVRGMGMGVKKVAKKGVDTATGLPIRKYIRWKRTIPVWKLPISRKKPPNACTILSKAGKSPKINLPERRKEVGRIRNPAA